MQGPAPREKVSRQKFSFGCVSLARELTAAQSKNQVLSPSSRLRVRLVS
jgi:hypothetical protein